MEQAKIEKIAETFKDEEFAKKIIKIKEKEELIKAFAEKGLALSVEEINYLIQKGQEAISNGEFGKIKKALSENELENIAGGDIQEILNGLIAGTALTFVAPIKMVKDSEEFPLSLEVGYLLSTAALTALAVPTVYKGLKAAGKGIYKAGSKVYNKVTGSSESNEN